MSDQQSGVVEQYKVTHTKFRCGRCGDLYVFLELADYPRYCPTCGADQDEL